MVVVETDPGSTRWRGRTVARLSPAPYRACSRHTRWARPAGIACWLEGRTRDRKVASSNPGSRAGEFSSPELTLCADTYSVSVPPPCYPSKSASGKLTPKPAYTLDPTKSEWADYAAVQA